jgi:hypothetical protein
MPHLMPGSNPTTSGWTSGTSPTAYSKLASAVIPPPCSTCRKHFQKRSIGLQGPKPKRPVEQVRALATKLTGSTAGAIHDKAAGDADPNVPSFTVTKEPAKQVTDALKPARGTPADQADLARPMTTDAALNYSDTSEVQTTSAITTSANPKNNHYFARLCASHGLYVFPCQNCPQNEKRHKKPWLKWRDASTTDVTQIDTWWTKWPNALPAIDLAKSGHLVVDCDRHPNDAGVIEHDGVAAFAALLDEHRTNPGAIPTAMTPSNGRHFWFQQRDGEPLGNARGCLPHAIDVRGVGGYIIAPAAQLLDGRHYALDASTPNIFEAWRTGTVPVPPRWLVNILRSNGHAQSTEKQQCVEAVADRHLAYAQSTLGRLSDELAGTSTGRRNATLNNAAFRMGRMIASGWISRADVEGSLADAAVACGLAHEEISATLRSGLNAGEKEPHGDLPDRPRSDRQTGKTKSTNAKSGNAGSDKKTALKSAAAANSGTDVSIGKISVGGVGFSNIVFPDLTENDGIKSTCTNARIAIVALGIECRHDVFHQKKLVGGHAIEQWAGELSDDACQMLRVIIRETFGFDPGRDATHDAERPAPRVFSVIISASHIQNDSNARKGPLVSIQFGTDLALAASGIGSGRRGRLRRSSRDTFQKSCRCRLPSQLDITRRGSVRGPFIQIQISAPPPFWSPPVPGIRRAPFLSSKALYSRNGPWALRASTAGTLQWVSRCTGGGSSWTTASTSYMDAKTGPHVQRSWAGIRKICSAVGAATL